MAATPPECRKLHRLLSAHVLGTLPDREELWAQGHVASCAECQRRVEEERAALAALDLLPSVEAPEGLAERTLEKVTAVHASPPSRHLRFSRFAIAVGAVVVLAVFLVHEITKPRESGFPVTSSNNLKQLGLVMKMYSNESKSELLPPLVADLDVWMPDLRVLYPEYITDLSILVDPEHPQAAQLYEEMWAVHEQATPDWDRLHKIAAQSYVYTGWAMKTVEDVEALAANRTRLAKLETEGGLSEEGVSIYRLREGIERFFITDINNPAGSAQAQSEIAIMFEHVKDEGCYVLFMDGHVEFIEKGKEFPVLDAVAEALGPPPALEDP